MFSGVRLIAAGLGVLSFAGGLVLLTAGGPAATAGLGPPIFGAVLLIAVVLERQRYRSETAERTGDRVGPGGGEPVGEPLPAGFQGTEERFVDPTTNRQMRVFVDPRTGERRYRAER